MTLLVLDNKTEISEVRVGSTVGLAEWRSLCVRACMCVCIVLYGSSPPQYCDDLENKSVSVCNFS